MVFCIAKNMLEKRLLYTAISRAKKQLFIIGNRSLFETQVRLKLKRIRQTTLQERITGVTEKKFRRFCTKNEQNPHVNLNSKNGEFWKKMNKTPMIT